MCARASLAVACVVCSIRALDLRVAPKKTEAVFLHNGSRGEPHEATIQMEDTLAHVGGYIKYLGLYVDSRWYFREHFVRLTPRLDGMAVQLRRLFPNMAGPGGRERSLYAGVLRSIKLYGVGKQPSGLATVTVHIAQVVKADGHQAVLGILYGISDGDGHPYGHAPFRTCHEDSRASFFANAGASSG